MVIKMKVHSVVGLITNSSTEIFSWATEGSVTTLKAHVDSFLKFLGREDTFDDLFNLEIVPTEWTVERWEELEEDEKEAYGDMNAWIKDTRYDEWPAETYMKITAKDSEEDLRWLEGLASGVYYQVAGVYY